ncbi:hypothetical protein SAMN04488510_10719 [Fervidobacterium changbaicum]|nr:DUF4350 domain-containing protein [Fervidobacterium changbaicum]SDH17999.1 hypothetical protein SAMN04488510_10719 [Fervidobacterium changbaicum]
MGELGSIQMLKVLITVLLVILTSVFAAPNFEYQIFYGNLHSHTSYSDGRGTPEQAYAHASRYADVLAVTDHCYFLKIPVNGQSKTFLTQQAARNATVPGKFVGLQGFEWTAGSGHINVYETLEFISRDEKGDLKDFYEWITKVKKLAQFNHPGVTFGNFQDFWFWPEADKYVNLIEIGNGNWSSADIISDEMYQNYILALNRGWHVSPTANQDNHKENWASANDARTGILAKALTYEDIMDALWSRRTFASEDKNAKLYFYANSTIMGSILPYSGKAQLYIYYSDKKDPVDRVYIVSQSKIYELSELSGKDEFEYSGVFDIPDGYEWFFVYIIQKDGNEIVSAPVWFETNSPIKVNYVRVGPKNPNVNQNVQITFDIYNSSEQPEEGVLKVLVNGNLAFNEKISLEPFGINYDKNIQLGKLAAGNVRVDFLINNVVVQSITFTVSEKSGLTILVDKLHENDITDEFLAILRALQENGNTVLFAETILKDYEEADLVIIPTPKQDGLDFFKDLIPDEVEWLNTFKGRVILLKGSDEEYFRKYTEMLTKATSANSVDELAKILGISTTTSNVTKQMKKAVYIDQGHANDYYKDKLTKLEKFLKSNGFEVVYTDKIQNIDGMYLIIMNGKSYTDDEVRNIVNFVRSGGILIITSKSDYNNGGNTEDLNYILDAINSPVRFNDDQVIDEVNNYGANYKVIANGVRFYSACSLVLYGNAQVLVASDTARSIDSDGRNDAEFVDKVVLAATFTSNSGRVFVLGKAIFSDYDYELNKDFIESVLFKIK